MMTTTPTRYLAPDWFTRRVFNPLVARLTRWGVSLKGSRVLEVRGRSSGETRSTVVNLLTVDGTPLPRGASRRDAVGAQPARRRRPRRAAPRSPRASRSPPTEVADGDKNPILRAYLKAWAWEVGRFFDGLTAESPDVDVDAAAAGFPVFRID